MRLVEKLKEKSRSKKFIVDCIYVFLSVFFGFWLFQEIKDIQIYSDIDYNSPNYIEVSADSEITLSPEIKTDRLYKIYFLTKSSEELTDKDFICKTELIHLTQIQKKENDTTLAIIKFPEPNSLKKITVKFSKHVKIFCNEKNVILTQQYGLPKKLCKLFILCFFFIFLIVFLITNILCTKIKSLAVKYLIFNILLGTAFIIVNPAFYVPDERIHFNRIYNMANIVSGKGSYEHNGGLLIRECDNRIYPAEIADNPLFTRQLSEFWEPQDYKRYYPYMITNILKPAQNTADIKIHFGLGEYKRCIYYIPQIAGIIISKALNFNQHQLYYFTCILALIFNTLILFFAFAKTRCKNILFYFFSLGAFVFQQMGHFTYDGTIYALAIGFIVLFFSFYEKRKVSDLVLSVIYLIMLWKAKEHLYMTLGLMYFTLFDFNRILTFSSKKKLIILSITSFILLLCGYLFYTLNYPENFRVSIGQHQENTFVGTKAGFIRNPISTILTIILSINHNFFTIFRSFFNFSLGVYDFCSCVILILITFRLIYAILKNKSTLLCNKQTKRIMLFICLLVIIGSYYGMYTGWKFNNTKISGVQGRYFIPVGLLFYMIINVRKNRLQESEDNTEILFYSTILLNFFIITNHFVNIMH